MPKNLILAVLFAREREQLRQQRLDILYPKGADRWSSPTSTDSEKAAALDALYSTKRQELRKLLGPEYDRLLLEEDPLTLLKWGPLPAEKLSSVRKIVEDYTSMALRGRGYTRGVDSASLVWDSTFDTEFERDIRSVLSPAEAEDFLLYNSKFALSLQKDLGRSEIEVDENAYKSLLASLKNLQAGFIKESQLNPSQENVYARLAMETKVFESILGPEAALKHAELRNSAYRPIDAMLQSSGLSKSQRIASYYAYTKSVETIVGAQALPPEQGKVVVAAEGEKIHAMLALSVPPAKLEEFYATSYGRTLKGWRSKNSVPDGP